MKTKTTVRYRLRTGEERQVMQVPVKAKILGAGLYEGSVTVWALVDRDEKKTNVMEFLVPLNGTAIDPTGFKWAGVAVNGGYDHHVFYKVQ